MNPPSAHDLAVSPSHYFTIPILKVFAKDAKYAARFKAKGLQIAAGVPFMLGEAEGTGSRCYRIGLFGLDKMQNIDVTIAKVSGKPYQRW